MINETIDIIKQSLQRAGPVSLIVANLIPLAGVLFWGWNVGALVTLYWAENLIIGLICLLKMYHLAGNKALGRMAFFTVHYGLFWFAHGAIIATVIDSHPVKSAGGFVTGNETDATELSDPLFEPIAAIFTNASDFWVWAFTALLVSHVVSLFVNYFRREEYRAETLNNLMMSPYQRVVILHVAVLFGGIAVEKLGSKIYLLVALVAIKTVVDIALHNREHKRPGHAYARDEHISATKSPDPTPKKPA